MCIACRMNREEEVKLGRRLKRVEMWFDNMMGMHGERCECDADYPDTPEDGSEELSEMQKAFRALPPAPADFDPHHGITIVPCGCYKKAAL